MKRALEERIVVTGLGIVSPVGSDPASLVDGLRSGRSGITKIAHLEATPFAGALGGAIARRRFPHPRGEAAVEHGVAAARQALAESGGTGPAERLALVIGTTMASRERPLDVFADDVRQALDLPGAMVIMISTACTSGADAIAFGAELLLMGAADRVLAGGTDEIDVKAFAGFHALKLLAQARCTPFGQEVGTMLGEGAAFLCLERASDAARRGHAYRAVLEGWASTSDAFHATSPHPSGDGLTRAAESALRRAGAEPGDVDWVSAHGTGTLANDAAESLAIDRVFAGRAVPVTALKSVVGHTLGAAGAVELGLAIIAMEAEVVPATIGVETLRQGCTLDLVRSPRSVRGERVLKLSAAFGGVNSATVITRRLPTSPSTPRAPRPVFIAGGASVGGADLAVDTFGESGELLDPARAFAIDELCPGIDARGLDGMSRLLMAASARALESAGIGPDALASSRSGLFVGQLCVSPSSHLEFDASALERGLTRVSASAFTRKVLNAATGATSRALALRGPTTTLSTGRGSGLVSAVLAAQRLAGSDEADLILAGGVDERDPDRGEVPHGEGAVVVALTSSAGLRRPPRARVTGWALGGPGERARTLEQATSAAPAGSHLFEASTSPRSAPAATGLLALGRALRAIDRGETTCAVVVEEGPLAVACLVLERADDVESHAR